MRPFAKSTKRVTFRMTPDEYRWLSRSAANGGYTTVSQFLKSVVAFGLMALSREWRALEPDAPADGVQEDIESMFRSCEESGGRLSWRADVNGRK